MERVLRDKLKGGAFGDVEPSRRRNMQQIRGSGNRTTERRLRGAMVRAGLRGWHTNNRAIKGSPDFLFPQHSLAVFVDGCFWHGCPLCSHVPKTNQDFWRAKIERNRHRDEQVTAALQVQGYEVIRFWEHELKTSPGDCIRTIRQLLERS